MPARKDNSGMTVQELIDSLNQITDSKKEVVNQYVVGVVTVIETDDGEIMIY